MYGTGLLQLILSDVGEIVLIKCNDFSIVIALYTS